MACGSVAIVLDPRPQFHRPPLRELLPGFSRLGIAKFQPILFLPQRMGGTISKE
jgi:hypothetical protein